ncbi:NAD-dependent epimerase/dehydratase family protein [Craurococcus roseus]|uniref:NAD-dependent epimerase/dehydratase family protein n=1 Tax=Craurococcus roseus TaxID=77585 RepID=UPI0031CE1F64
MTGGTGFLGRHVVQALARGGWRLRLLARRPDASPAPPAEAEVVPGDLDDPAALRRLVEGARAVVHVAGLTKALRASDFMAVNRDGGARLAAAAGAGVARGARLVLVSSQAAREPRLSPYAASKRAGEEAAVSALGGRVPWVVLRPPVIYGPGDREGLALLRLARAPVVPVPRAPEPRLAMVHAADAAAAVAALCREGAPFGARFEITDGRHEGHAWRDILRLVAGLAGHERPPRFLPVPDAALLAAGAAADAWAAATGRASLFGRGKAREFLHRNWGSAPERQPPPDVWAPRIDLESGLRETLAWWRADAGGASAPVGGG